MGFSISSIAKSLFSRVETNLLNDIQGEISKGVSSTQIVPGDVRLLDISIHKEDGSGGCSIMTNAKVIDIYESILTPVIFAEIQMVDHDTVGLYERIKMGNEDYVTLKFATPASSTIKYILRVRAIPDYKVNETMTARTYTLQCVSAEALRSAESLVAPRKEEESVDKIITSILKDDLHTSKHLSIDTSVGVVPLNIVNARPFEAIDYLRKRAVSSEYKSDSWVFFENKDGYNFTTIEKLISEGGKKLNGLVGTSDRVFFFDTARKEAWNVDSFRNILAFNHLMQGDTVAAAANHVNSKAAEVNFLTGDTRYSEQTVKDLQTKASTQNAKPINTAGYKSRHSAGYSKVYVVPTNSERVNDPINIAERIQRGNTYAQQIIRNLTQIHVYGDTNMTVGVAIRCELPDITDQNQTAPQTGVYLVSKLRHIIINSDRPQHTMALELIRTDKEN